MAIIYPDIDSVGWGDDVNANFRELNQNDTDIKATIGTETIGTTATTLKGAIKEVKGIADNNTTQLNQKVNKSDIVDNLSSTEEGKVLSARQGKQLADKLEKEIILETIPSVTGAYNDDNNYHPRAFINGNSVNIQGLVYISSINSDLTLFNNVPVCKYQGWRKVFGYDNDNNFNVFINPNGTITGTPKIVGTYIFDFSYIKA